MALTGLAARGREGVDLLAVAAGLGGAALVGGLALIWTGTLPSGQIRWGFTAMHLLYLGITVSLPILGVGLLALRSRSGGGRLPLVLGVALLVPAPMGAYATHVEPHWLRVDQVTVAVSAERAGHEPVRIAVLADYQTTYVGSHERAAVDAVLAADPDLILLPGDIFQGSPEQREGGAPRPAAGPRKAAGPARRLLRARRHGRG